MLTTCLTTKITLACAIVGRSIIFFAMQVSETSDGSGTAVPVLPISLHE